ncbi:MAG: CBS domain-containing protein [Methylococcaceae bacterium]|jgi:signal-transduction protein with cAMP-binding, CBS, and nucleotidyltransferase domain
MTQELKSIPVKKVMKTAFTCIDRKATIKEALNAMKSAGTSVLIVNKRHDDDEYGLITSTDIARHVLAKDRAPDRVNVYEVMTCPVIHVHPDMDIRHCSRLFATYNLVRAPVIENDKIIGMISPNSLVLEGLYEICG